MSRRLLARVILGIFLGRLKLLFSNIYNLNFIYFSAKCKTTSKIYALKQQRPANLWEFYICLEIATRMNDFPFMVINFDKSFLNCDALIRIVVYIDGCIYVR